MSSPGQIIGGVVGAVIGFVGTGFNPVGAFQGAAIGASIGAALDPPKGPTVEGPRLQDKGVQTSTYGTSMPRVYGTIGGSGNITQIENNQLKETVRKQKQGGKGGGSSTTTRTYSYSATFQLSLCEGPIAGVRRIWCSDKLIYNAGSDDLETIIASNQAASGFRIYLGTDDQMPDPRYEAEYGVGNVSAHRGEAYIAFYDFQLADYSNTLQAAQFKVEIVNSITLSNEYMFSYIGSVINTSLASPRPSNMHGTNLESYFCTFDGGTGGNGGLHVFTRSGVRRDIDYFSEYSPIAPSEVFRPDRTLSSDTLEGWFYQDSGDQDHFYIRQSGSTKYYQSILAIESNKRMIERSGFFWMRYGPSGTPDLSSLEFADGGDTTDGQIIASATIPFTPAYCIAGLSDGRLARCSFSMIYPASSAVVGFGIMDRSLSVIDSGSFVINRPDNTTAQDFLGSLSFGYVDDLGIMYVVFGQDFTGVDLQDGRFFYFSFDTSTGNLVSDVQPLFHPTRVEFEPELVSVKDGLMIVGDTTIAIPTCGVVSYAIAIQGNQPAQLSDIVNSEVSRSSLLGVSDISTVLISENVRGYRVNGGSLRSAIEPLQAAFPFDVRQHGYQIQFLPRGQPSVVTIPWEDLGATDGDRATDIIQQSREMDSQLPARTTIKYLDAAREYAIAEQYSERLNTEAINRVDRQLPLVLTADEAAGVSEVLNFLPWLERTDAAFTLPPTYRYLEPGDVVTVETQDATYEFRLTEINETPSGFLEVKARPNRAALYTSEATGSEGVPPTGTIGLAGPSLFVPLDIPVVDETLQDDPGFVGVMTGTTNGWPGALSVRSNDGGQTWTDLQAYNTKASIGSARETLSASTGTMIDQSTITVDMVSGTLESITKDQMLSGINYAAYGLDGRWEILRFQNATLQVDGSYLVSHFVRGDRGTEWATGLHAAGDYFVLLDDPDNAFIGSPVESIALERLYRGVTSGASIDSAVDVSFTYQGVNLECLSPVYASGTRDGSSNFTGTFTRRSRLSSSWWTTGTEAPLGETTQSYEIDVMNGSTVERTITAVTPTFTYSAADQTTDFGSPQSPITFRIYQLSGIVGRGYPYEVTL